MCIILHLYSSILLSREVEDQNELGKSINELIYWSQQFISGSLTKEDLCVKIK